MNSRLPRLGLEWREKPGAKWLGHCSSPTFASRLVMSGVDLRTVGELLGHWTFQMTCAMLIERQIISAKRCLAWIRKPVQVVPPDEDHKGQLSGSGEMADALGLGPSGEIRGGSSPFSRTNSSWN